MTNDQIKSLAGKAASPSTGVIQNDMIPVRMAASPSSLVGMNMSSPAMAMKSDQLKMMMQGMKTATPAFGF